MTVPEYMQVLDIIAARGLSDLPLKIYTVGHDFSGYPVGSPNAGVVYFSSTKMTQQGPWPVVDPAGGPPVTYTCLALEAITAIELSTNT